MFLGHEKKKNIEPRENQAPKVTTDINSYGSRCFKNPPLLHYNLICGIHLRPNNDLSQTSPCNIKGLSVGEVKRIENMITQTHSIDI